MSPIKASVINEVRVRTLPEVSDASWTPLVLRAGQVLSGEVVNGWFVYSDPRYVIYAREGQRQELLYSILQDGDTELIRTSDAPVPVPQPEPMKRTAFKLGISVLVNHHLLEPPIRLAYAHS